MNNIQDVIPSLLRLNYQISQDDFLSLKSKTKSDLLQKISASLHLEIYEFFLIMIFIVILFGLLIVIMNKYCRAKPTDGQVHQTSSNLLSRPLFLRGYSPENPVV